jgi:hypothetical protein
MQMPKHELALLAAIAAAICFGFAGWAMKKHQ